MSHSFCSCCRNLEGGSKGKTNFYNEHFIPRRWKLQYFSGLSEGVQLILTGYCKDCYDDLEEIIPIPKSRTVNALLKKIYDTMRTAHPYDKFDKIAGYYGPCKARSAFYHAQDKQSQSERNKAFLDLFHDYDRAQVRQWLEKNFPPLSRDEVLRDTAGDLFCTVVRSAKADGDLDKAEGILDYILPCEHETGSREGIKLTSYEFDFVPIINFGCSEGIYIDCYLKGKFDESGRHSVHVGTLKTLQTDLDACKIMGELCGTLIFHANKHVNANINRYMPDNQSKETE